MYDPLSSQEPERHLAQEPTLTLKLLNILQAKRISSKKTKGLLIANQQPFSS